MAGRRTSRAAAVLALIAVTMGARPAPGHAVVDDPDLETFAAYEYRVDGAAGRVAVTISLDVTADKPNRPISGGTYQYYFQGYYLPIPADAEGVTVTDAQGAALNFVVSDTNEFAQFLEIDFRRNIFYRQTARVVVSFSLPEGAPRSESSTRVNDAYAGFGVWTAPGLEGATVTIIVPRGFEDRSVGSQVFRVRLEEGEEWFVAEDVDPESFWAGVSLARDVALASTDLRVDGHEVRIRAWPGDTTWADFVSENLEVGLPVLVEQVGLPWPIDDELTVVESYSPYLNGYAGWYDKNSHIIEIGDELDAHLIFHEVSHVWFNDDLFDQRWITEGLADEFAAAVVEGVGEERPEPASTSLIDGAAGPLNSWTLQGSDEEQERWSYGASWTVTHGIVDAVGMQTLANVVAAASADEISYVGDGPAEPGSGQADWRVYLDLLENQGNVTDGSISELFEEWVLTDRQVDLLEARASSRESYEELDQLGGAWAPPLAVRAAMADWSFAEADEQIAVAQTLLGERDELLELIAPVGAPLPRSLEETFERAEDDLGEVEALMADARAAAQDLRATHDRLADSTGPLQRIGMIGGDHATRLEEAAATFGDGDLIATSDQAAAIDQDLANLTRTGAIRLGVGAAVVLLLGGLLKNRRRRSRSRSAGVVGEPTEIEATGEQTSVSRSSSSDSAPTPAQAESYDRAGR